MGSSASVPHDSPGGVIAREVLAHVASLALFPFGIGRTKKRTVRRKDQRTIVLVHGYLANSSYFFPLRSYLWVSGFRQILSFNYQSSIGIEKSARELRKFLQHHVRGGRIDLVCHSLGGLIARFYVQELGGARRVDRCITLGTPHQGTYNAYWIPSRVGRELRPESDLLHRLNSSKAEKERVKYTSIVGESDNIVLPRSHGIYPPDKVVIPKVGHLGVLFAPSTFQTVAQRLCEE